MKTYLTIVRHGETEWNKIGRQQGHLNSNLTENGIKQAEAIKNFINNEYNFIISSDLGRAIQTAEIATGIKAINDIRLDVFDLEEADRLIEANLQEIERLQEKIKKYPIIIKQQTKILVIIAIKN